jgi:ubiquinone biosynthesis accessory factor UbiJ
MFLESLFRAGQTWHEETLATLQLNVVEFLQDETRDLPAMVEAEMFYEQVTKLQHDELALTEKLNRLTVQTK